MWMSENRSGLFQDKQFDFQPSYLWKPLQWQRWAKLVGIVRFCVAKTLCIYNNLSAVFYIKINFIDSIYKVTYGIYLMSYCKLNKFLRVFAKEGYFNL